MRHCFQGPVIQQLILDCDYTNALQLQFPVQIDALTPLIVWNTSNHLLIRAWRVPAQVIYFGDHLFSDLKGPAKAGWRTAAVIRELEVLTT